jgi:N-methylhydantoinase B
VAADAARHLLRERTAELVYGAVLAADGTVDVDATRTRREAIRRARLEGTVQERPPELDAAGWRPSLRFHEALELGAGTDGVAAIRCRCGQVLCAADQNYKRFVPRSRVDLEELAGHRMPDGSPYLAELRAYACPGCATLLQVDVWVPELDGEEDLWDIRIASR